MPEAPAVAIADSTATRHIVIGGTAHADCLSGALRAIERDVTHLPAPEEGELVDALRGPVSVVVVLTGDDDLSLRYAVDVSRRAPLARLLVGIRNPDISARLADAVPTCVVLADGRSHPPASRSTTNADVRAPRHRSESAATAPTAPTRNGLAQTLQQRSDIERLQ